MADGITLNETSGGETVKTDDDGSFHWQYVKLAFGADNTQTIVGSTASNPLPVALSDTDNAVLDAIAASLVDVETNTDYGAVTGGGVEASALRVTLASDSTGVISVDDNGANLSVDWGGTAPPIGAGVEATALRVTLATDSTGLVSVDDNGGALTVDNGGTFVTQVDGAALTALQVIDNPVFADDAAFTLTSSSAMVAGAVRDDTLSALSAVEGDVVPLRVGSTGALHVTGSSGSTQYAEDAAHTTGDTGTMALAVRNDTLAALGGTDGDYSPLQVNASGALFVEVSSYADTQIDDAAFTPATDAVAMVGFTFDDTTPDSVDEGDGGAARMTANRMQLVVPNAHATGGMSYDQLALAAEDNDKVIKGSAGTLYFVSIQSLDTTPVYLKLFDAASITPGTTSADFQFMCPAVANGGSLTLNFSPGIEMGTGIVALVATGIALDNNTAVSANEVIVVLGFE